MMKNGYQGSVEQAGSQPVAEIDRICIETGAIAKLPLYLEEKGFERASLVVDRTTYEAAGRGLEAAVSRTGIRVQTTIILPDLEGDVIADEASIIQLILDLQNHGAEVVLAVGGGTLHDICRYSAYTAGIPFISIPTAPSVDGFNSKGAPIIVRGEKKTILAIGPLAIFADLDILVQAPSRLVAAGFGDMLGKYTSLFDWKFEAVVTGGTYLEKSAEMTRAALESCVRAAESIAARQEDGIRTLMSALVESGLAMLLFGQSHPASGAEHHLSHYWEMEYLRLGKRQLLHGAKVGVACMEISKLYRRIAHEGPAPWMLRDGFMNPEKDAGQTIAAHWEEIRRELGRIPEPEQLAELLAAAGGPVSIAELGVSSELLARSLREAHRVRPGRFTLLKAYNERATAH